MCLLMNIRMYVQLLINFTIIIIYTIINIINCARGEVTRVFNQYLFDH